MTVEEENVETTGMSEQEVQAGAVEVPEAAEPAAMPEGATTEEAEVLDTETQLAAEALAATEDVQEAPEGVTVPVAVVAELRAERRENRQAIEALNARLVELTKPPEPAPVPSPLEKWVAENPEDAEVTSPPGTVQLAEKRWQDQQAKVSAERQGQQQHAARATESLKKAEATIKDYREVVEMGRKYLTPGNNVDIANSPDIAMALYKMCVEATLKSGTPDAAQLRAKLQQKVAQTKSGPKPQATQPVTPGTRTPAAPAQELPSTAPPSNPRLAHIYGALRL